MSTSPLADPKLSAFFAGDPSVLAPPDSFETQSAIVPKTYTPPKSEAPALELAAAFLVVAGLVARHLANREPDAQPGLAGRSAWRMFAPVWLRLAVPAVRHAYTQGKVTGSPAELEAMAVDYAATLGDYIGDSSADALEQGVGEQLNAKWSERVAWQRASAGYGLDQASMHAHIAGLMRRGEQGQTDVMPHLARLFVDKLLIRRADRLGQTEAWRAQQSGKVISWLYLQRAGKLPASARKQWKTREDESTCPVCAPLDETLVELAEPWITSEGVRLWAPSAHPGCRCEAELVVPDVDLHLIGKAYDPHEPRDASSGRWSRTSGPRRPQVKVKEREQTDDVVGQLRRNATPEDAAQAETNPFEQTTNPFAANPFEAAAANPFAAAARNPFAAAPANPFAANPFSEAKAANPFGIPRDGRTARPGAGTIRRRRIRHVYLAPKQTGLGSVSDPFYLPAEEFFRAYESNESEYNYQFSPGDVLDFSEANEAARYTWELDEDDAFIMAAVHAPTLQHAMSHEEAYDTPEAWGLLRPTMLSVRNDAMDRADTIVDQLDRGDIRAIYHWAGMDTNEKLDTARQRIKHAVTHPEDDPAGLGDAYGDYATFIVPKLVSADGETLNRELDSMADSEWMPEGPKQSFIFENGFHPGALVSHSGKVVELHGSFVVTHCSYHSALAEDGLGSPEGVIGWRMNYMAPVGTAGALGDPPADDLAPDYEEAARRLRNGGVT